MTFTTTKGFNSSRFSGMSDSELKQQVSLGALSTYDMERLNSGSVQRAYGDDYAAKQYSKFASYGNPDASQWEAKAKALTPVKAAPPVATTPAALPPTTSTTPTATPADTPTAASPATPAGDGAAATTGGNVGEEVVAGPELDIVVTPQEPPEDNRIRLSALAGKAVDIYGPNDKSANILAPLHTTGGLMFPYTPSIRVSGDTDWTPHQLTHTNYDIYSYQRTPSATITLSGKFTVQNQREGEYALACIHFLRTVGKMYYGEQDSADYDPKATTQSTSKAGLPPPVLRLRGYGAYMFKDLKCVLKSYDYSYEENMDTVTIQTVNGDVVLPALFTLNVNVLLQQNSTSLRRDFKLDDFRTGALLSKGGWF